MKTIKEVDIYESPLRERNFDKYGYRDNQCECCGKILKDTSKKYFIHATTNWKAVPVNVTDEELNSCGLESQGLFLVGSSCAKHFPKGYTIEHNEINS